MDYAPGITTRTATAAIMVAPRCPTARDNVACPLTDGGPCAIEECLRAGYCTSQTDR